MYSSTNKPRIGEIYRYKCPTGLRESLYIFLGYSTMGRLKMSCIKKIKGREIGIRWSINGSFYKASVKVNCGLSQHKIGAFYD